MFRLINPKNIFVLYLNLFTMFVGSAMMGMNPAEVWLFFGAAVMDGVMDRPINRVFRPSWHNFGDPENYYPGEGHGAVDRDQE